MIDNPEIINNCIKVVTEAIDVFKGIFTTTTNMFVHKRTVDPRADFNALAIGLYSRYGARTFVGHPEDCENTGYFIMKMALDSAIARGGHEGLAAAQVKADVELFAKHHKTSGIRIVDPRFYEAVNNGNVNDWHADNIGSVIRKLARSMTCYTPPVTNFLPNEYAEPASRHKGAYSATDESKIHTLSVFDVWKQAALNHNGVLPVIHAANTNFIEGLPRLMTIGDDPGWRHYQSQFRRLMHSVGLGF